MFKLKVIQVGNSLAVLLPKVLTFGLNAEKGDIFYATRYGDGLLVSRADPDFEEKMASHMRQEARIARVRQAIAGGE